MKVVNLIGTVGPKTERQYALQAKIVHISLEEREKVARDNPKLQFDLTESNEQNIAYAVTNAVQLAQMQGGSEQFNKILKKYGMERPSVEDIGSENGLKNAQEKIKDLLSRRPKSEIDEMDNEMRELMDDLIHAVAVKKGGIINTSA